jgi:hypothetical protein
VIDILKALLDFVLKALPQLTDKREGGQKRKLGVELFLIYVEANEIVPVGERIIESLETFAKAMEYAGDTPQEYDLFGPVLSVEEFEKQLRRLEHVSSLIFGRHAAVLQILNVDAYYTMDRLMYAKYRDISLLLKELRQWGTSHILPLGAAGDTFDATLQALRRRPSPDELDAELQQVGGRANADTLHLCTDMYGRTLVVRGNGQYQRIARYLRERQPRERLTDVRQALADLRACLEDHFVIADILTAVDQSYGSRWFSDEFSAR